MIGSSTVLLCWSFLIAIDQGSSTELFCCSLVILCSELFVGLFFLDLVLVSWGLLFSISIFSSCLDLLSVSIFSVSCKL